MCTIVLAWRVWPGWPVVVAANRDEALARPAEPPAVREHEGTRVFTPRDVQAGGTWIGVSAAPRFAGLTNRFDPATFGRRAPGSRGRIVLEALAGGSAAVGAQRVSAIDPAGQGPFHLLVADRESAQLVRSDMTRMHAETLQPGVYIVTERSFDAAPTSREPRLRALLGALPDREPPPPSQWRQWLSVHADDPLEGTCVHADARGYGTRSSSVLMIPATGPTQWHHADGPPCVTPYVDLGPQLATL